MKKFGLIGKTLVHSFSQKYFDEKFKAEGLNNCKYDLYDTDSLTELVRNLKSNPELKGLNVTIPYKEEILDFLDEISNDAHSIGAVNCIRVQELNGATTWKGFNTDYIGFEKSLSETQWDGIEEAYILGSGGASKAIQYVLRDRAIPFHIVSRNPSENQISYRDITYDSPKAKLLVNTTPLGTYPDINSFPPISYDKLHRNDFLYDLTYNPENTAFMRKGKANGCEVMNGYEMLKIQAEESWRIWSGSND